jgi:hypothetical protein
MLSAGRHIVGEFANVVASVVKSLTRKELSDFSHL